MKTQFETYLEVGSVRELYKRREFPGGTTDPVGTCKISGFQHLVTGYGL